MPLSSYQISLNTTTVEQNIKENPQKVVNINSENSLTANNHNHETLLGDNSLDLISIFSAIYIVIVLLLLSRFLIHLHKIVHLYRSCEKIKQGELTLLINKKIESPFSFFSCIFVPDNWLKDPENREILTHEKIHASQYHSLDIILIELISAVMWFNPLIWMMKRSIQLVHEYLADEGVLNTGTDKLRYQALLINQVAEEKLICISSSFNHSLIKKRMNMMTKSKFNRGSKLKILMLIPLAAITFIGVAITNKQEAKDINNGFTVLIDAGHGGRDPGAKVNDKIMEKDIVLSITKKLKAKTLSNKKFNLIFTRERDEYLELKRRIGSNVDLLISVHTNMANNKEYSGIECYIAKESEYKNKSKTIASLIVTKLSQLRGIETTTSLKEANFFILKNSKCPSLLLNIGYLSNANDLAYISNLKNQELICDKIIDAISQLN